ncbi:hypothetical protein SAMN04489717_0159 [Actinopolymorpha singaporensis]|uniref:Uncharacterized protein n=2 Tax=Actinopolymorpha singaporensis TaxID=117157 RepID=A0A1H1L778_9ACTN|nr:hypothetical protein SAMN04489717_0159 [Actinopolymorpha singaporensis]
MSAGRSAFALADDADEATAIAAHQEGLRVVRGALRRVWIDAISDSPWPEQAQVALRALLDLAELHHTSDTGIELDVSDDDQFDLVVALSPFTISAEGWAESDEQIYSASDTGTGLWMALTPREHSEVRERLLTRGADPNAIIPQPPRRRLDGCSF